MNNDNALFTTIILVAVISMSAMAMSLYFVVPHAAFTSEESYIVRIRNNDSWTDVCLVTNKNGQFWKCESLFSHIRLCREDKTFDLKTKCSPFGADSNSMILRQYAKVQNSARVCCK